MKFFDYSELIRVIDNVEIREANEKELALMNLRDKCINLEKEMINSGIFDDWYRLKELCYKAGIRLCVACQGDSSMGVIIGHPDGYSYCIEYQDGPPMYNNSNGMYATCVDSGSYYSNYFGFNYTPNIGFVWRVFRSNSNDFTIFKNKEEEYTTKIKLLKSFKATYEDYRDYQLGRIEKKFKNRIKTEDILK